MANTRWRMEGLISKIIILALRLPPSNFISNRVNNCHHNITINHRAISTWIIVHLGAQGAYQKPTTALHNCVQTSSWTTVKYLPTHNHGPSSTNPSTNQLTTCHQSITQSSRCQCQHMVGSDSERWTARGFRITANSWIRTFKYSRRSIGNSWASRVPKAIEEYLSATYIPRKLWAINSGRLSTRTSLNSIN